MRTIKTINSCNPLSLTTPVSKSGRITNYAKIILAAINSDEKSFTKSQLLFDACPEKFPNETRDTAKARPGYYSNVFSILNVNEIITYNATSKKLEGGKNLEKYFNENILPGINSLKF